MNYPSRRFSGSAALLGLILLVPLATFGDPAPASNATATSNPPPTPNPPDQTVTLQEFNVTAQSTSGYVASESTTGTRVATKIADLPFVVNVITSDFLSDFSAFELTGQDMGFVSSLSLVDAEGNFTMRGFKATFTLWNGFYRLGLEDPVDIDRIEFIKGDNAAIYGQTSPAGMVNFITRRPTATANQFLEYDYGSFNTERVQGRFNTPLGTVDGVGFTNLVSFAALDRTYGTPYSYLHSRTFADALVATPNDHSSLLMQVEWVQTLSDPITSEQLFDYNSTTKTYTGALAPLSLSRFSQGGPNADEAREQTSLNIEYENRFSDVWSLRLSEYYYHRNAFDFNNGISNEFDPTLNEIVGVSNKVLYDKLNQDGGASQADLLAHYWLFNHTVENKTLFTLDWSEDWRYRVQKQLPSTLNTVATSQKLDDPVYSGTPLDYNLYTIATRNDHVRWDTSGAFVSDQISMFSDRLLIFTGLRYDNVLFNLDYGNQYNTKAPYGISTPGEVQHFYDDALSPQLGYNVKVVKHLAVYNSWSTSFLPNAQDAKLGDPELGNQHGRGWDYGIKANFFDERLIFTLGGYYVTQTGLKATVLGSDGIDDTVPAGTQNSRGVESDATFQVSQSLFVGAGFGYVNARITYNGTDTIALGRVAEGVPVDNGYLVLRDDLSGLKGFKGLSAILGVIYDGASYPETEGATAAEAGIKVPSYYTAITGLNYEWNSSIFGEKITNTVKFTIKNLLNRQYVDANLTPGDSRGYYITYMLRH